MSFWVTQNVLLQICYSKDCGTFSFSIEPWRRGCCQSSRTCQKKYWNAARLTWKSGPEFSPSGAKFRYEIQQSSLNYNIYKVVKHDVKPHFTLHNVMWRLNMQDIHNWAFPFPVFCWMLYIKKSLKDHKRRWTCTCRVVLGWVTQAG